MRHYRALKKLMPIDLGDISDKDMFIEGEILDAVADAVASMLSEWFPSTANMLLGRWEEEFGISPTPGESIVSRRERVLFWYRYIGRLDKDAFIGLAAALGYDIEISEGGETEPFRAGISKAGDRVYNSTGLWVWTVTTLNRPPEPDLMSLFRDINPPHMKIIFAQRGVG